MKGSTMSKTKQALDEDFSVLTGQELSTEPDDIPQEYMLMASIGSDIRHLENFVIAPQDAKALRGYAKQLNELADKAEKPL
mgnify:FL=1